MRHFLYVLMVAFLLSCGASKKAVVDPYVGKYEVTVFEVDGMGDIPVELIISKGESGYVAQMLDPSGTNEIEVMSTTLNGTTFQMEATSMGIDFYLSIDIEGDSVSGSMMDMFNIGGSRVKQ